MDGLPTGTKMIYCAYCGKGFTRKEHLERHLPSHTNVKPYRCQSCHLSFTRRDLLQRHINTYHVAKNPMERSQHGVHTITGKNQIACLNCAQAKTGCDKQLPRCTRCREKGLNCEPRYARRSTKAVARATAAATAATANLESMVAAMPPTPQDSSMMPVMMDSDPRLEFQAKVSMSPAEGPLTMDPQMPQYDDLYKKSSMAGAQMTLEGQYSLSNMPENYGDLMYSPTMIQNTGFPEVWHWNAYPLFEPNYSALQSTQANASIQSLEDVMDTTSVHVSPPQPLMDAISIGTNSAHVSPVQPLLDVISMTTNPTHVSPAQLDAISMSTNSEHVTPSLDYTHTRSTSITSTTDPEPRIVETAIPSPLNSVVLDFNEVITAEAAWPLARCNPVSYSGSCPLTAFKHLGFLGRKLRDEDSWSGLAEAIEATEDNRAGAAIIVPTQPQIRDRIIAIAQRYLHKALEIHRNNCRGEDQVAILVLPSCGILDYFLQCYVRSLSSFYSLAPGGRIDANEMVKNNESAALLVLLMIAQGASVVPRDEARILATGLTETCRISLFDMIEKNVVMCADATLNRCALLFTLLGAWSGDKWLMDIAMGQRGMYLSMLRHAGVFEPHSPVPPSFNDPSKIKQQWDAWMERESQNRLVYNWVMVDQELSLFHDTAPLLAVSDLCAPLPGPEDLWLSGNEHQWMMSMRPYASQPLLTPSLHGLFQDFANNRLSTEQMANMTPYRMRLLLHPLQSLLWHIRTLTLHFPGMPDPRGWASIEENTSPATFRRAAVHGLLSKWLNMCNSYLADNPTCPISQTNLLLFHLISLNSITNFPEIEKYARGQGQNGPQENENRIYVPGETLYHCAEVIQLVQAMPADRRPVWWSAAIYRVALILWTFSMIRPNLASQQDPENESSMFMDNGELIGESSWAFMWKNTATVILTGPNGTTLSLEEPSAILDYAESMVRQGIVTRFDGGIKRKLDCMNHLWHNGT